MIDVKEITTKGVKKFKKNQTTVWNSCYSEGKKRNSESQPHARAEKEAKGWNPSPLAILKYALWQYVTIVRVVQGLWS